MRAKKYLGQNFLVDENKINKIVSSIESDSSTTIYEVGPGLGALTHRLATKAQKLIAIEIDQEAIDVLKNTINSNVEIIKNDALEFDFEKHILSSKTKKNIFVSNLPYYISTPILFKVLMVESFETLNFMIQKELADRITALPNSKNFGRLTVCLMTFFDLKERIQVPSGCFQPKPNVDSTFLILERKKIKIFDESYFKFVKDCFQQKRKTLINSLCGGDIRKKSVLEIWLKKNSLPNNIRAEQLEIEQFVELYTLEFKSFYIN